MKQLCTLYAFLIVLCGLILYACSKGTEENNPVGAPSQFTEQAKEAVQEQARRSIDRARMTQGLGDERTEAMDEAVKSLGR